MNQPNQARSSATLPHALDIEAGVLGSCLYDRRYWALAESIDTDVTSLFYDASHHVVASAMHGLHSLGRLVTQDAVADMLRTMGQTLDGGTREFLTELSLRASTRGLEQFKDSISQLAEKRALRRIATMTFDICERARRGDELPSDLAEAMHGVIEASHSGGHQLMTLGEHLAVDTRANYAVSTGIQELDNKIQGWVAGRLYAIGARPKVGKTAMALNGAIRALSDDVPVLFFSLEMTARELYGRLLSATAFVPATSIKKYLDGESSLDDFPQGHREDVEAAEHSLKQASLYIVEASQVRGLHDVLAAAVDFRSKHPDGPILIILDYVQLLVRDARDAHAELTNITRELKLLSSRIDSPVVVLSQINREGADAVDGMPSPHHMKNSGSLEQDSDAVILLNRRNLQDENHPAEDMDIRVALCRYAPSGWVKAHFFAEEQAITDQMPGVLGSAGEMGSAVSNPDARTSTRRDRPPLAAPASVAPSEQSATARMPAAEATPPWATEGANTSNGAAESGFGFDFAAEAGDLGIEWDD